MGNKAAKAVFDQGVISSEFLVRDLEFMVPLIGFDSRLGLAHDEKCKGP